MKAVINKEKFTCSFLLEDGTLITKEVNADKLFDKLIENNWDYAEPGILYWDTINNNNLLSEYIKAGDFEYAGVNPCAEEPLPAGGACNLGALNLSKFVTNPYTEYAEVDMLSLEYAIRIAVFALNDVLLEGADLHPLEVQRESAKKYRQIGLGIMGFADMLIKLGITYGSQECIDKINELGNFILYNAILASNEYMKANNLKPFDGYDYNKIVNSKSIQTLKENNSYTSRLDKALKEGLFNSQLLTIAPTGSIAGMLETSYGAEPFFSLKYTRKTQSLHNGEEVSYLIDNIQAEEYKEIHDLTDDDDLPEFFITTHQISVEDRVNVQATWQKYIDASISSTVNLPKSATVEDVKQAYILAWEKGCKGLTIYRAGCKREGVLTEGDKEEKEVEVVVTEKVDETGLQFGDTLLIDNNVRGVYRELTTGCGHLHCNFYFDPDTGELRQVFLDKGSKGGCLSMINAVSRLTSLCARKGAPAEEIVDQLLSVVDCPAYQVSKHVTHATSKGSSCASAVAYALLDAHKEFCEEYGINEYEEEEQVDVKKAVKPKITKEKVKEKANSLDDYYTECPSCGQKTLLAIGGCVSCQNPECSWSKCG